MNISINITQYTPTIKPPYQPSPGTLFVAYLSLIIMFLGVVGNSTSFCVFRFHKSFKTMPSMVFLSFVAISDTIALFEWNFGHYFQLIHNIDLSSLSLMGCRFYSFAQYTSLQSSGLLLSVMCIDRYVTVMAMPGSFLQKLPFRTVKTSFYWSIGVVLFCFFLNIHLLFTQGKNKFNSIFV